MNELMALALMVMQAGIIAGIGYSCYKVGYSKGNQDGMDMHRLLSEAFEKSGEENG